MTRSRASAQPSTSPLEGLFDNLTSLLMACGYERAAIQRHALKALRAAPKSKHRRTLDADWVLDAPHVLTLWYRDPKLLKPDGRPRPLALLGSTASVESLVRQVRPEKDPRIMVRYLKRVGALQKSGRGWIPTQQHLLFSEDPLGTAVHALQGLLGYLRTARRNVHRRKSDPPWFEARMTSRPLPQRERARIDRLVRELGHAYLATLDRRLAALEDPAAASKDTLRVGIGSYYFEIPA